MRYRLDVPFSQKEQAKDAGTIHWQPAKDNAKGYWYSKTEPTGALRRWYHPEYGNRMIAEPGDVPQAVVLPATVVQPNVAQADVIPATVVQRTTNQANAALRTADQVTIIQPAANPTTVNHEAANRINAYHETAQVPFENAGNNPAETTGVRANAVATDADQNMNIAGHALAEFKKVSDITTLISNTLTSSPELRTILVKGEVSGYRGTAVGGYYYFNIKEGDNYAIQCLLKEEDQEHIFLTPIEDGKEVAIIGRLNFYQKKSNVSLYVNKVMELGEGAEKLRIELLMQRLSTEGLFDVSHKKQIPKHLKRIAIITSENGEAYGDIQKQRNERNPYIPTYLYPARVQGIHAASTIIEGIRYMDSRGFDVIVISRGGGAKEDLSAFQDEDLARAVFAAHTPIISAVGHENDWTIIDFVADARYATPTEVGRVVFPNVKEDLRHIGDLSTEMQHTMEQRVKQLLLELQAKASELEANGPIHRLKDRQNKLTLVTSQMQQNMQNIYADRLQRKEKEGSLLQQNMKDIYISRKQELERKDSSLHREMEKLVSGKKQDLEIKKIHLPQYMNTIYMNKKNQLERSSSFLQQNMKQAFETRRHRYEVLTVQLHGASPTAKLINGFGCITSGEKPVTGIADVKAGDDLKLVIHDGEIDAKVLATRNVKI